MFDSVARYHPQLLSILRIVSGCCCSNTARPRFWAFRSSKARRRPA